jgi:hypothetical protein
VKNLGLRAGFLCLVAVKISYVEYPMKKISFRLLLCFFALSGAMFGAQSNARPGSQHAKRESSPQKTGAEVAKQPKKDPCALLTPADVQAVQGDAVQETKLSAQPGAQLVISQCIFRTATPSKSISVAIASPGSISPRAFWQKQFRSGKSASAEEAKSEKELESKKQEKEEDDESTRPRAIADVGEQAFWVGGPMVGALYVLKGDTFLRISVGGVREESARIEKSVALARLALKRL